MKVLVVEDENAEKAQAKLATDLGVEPAHLKFVKQDRKKFSFEVLSCPASVEVEISRDGMRAYIKRLYLPIGEGAPALTTDFVVEALKKKKVVSGLKYDVISKELFKILQTPGYNDAAELNLLVAEGIEPIAAQTGRPQWIVDIKLFEKKIPVFVRKGEVIARAPSATKGSDGVKVTGEVIPCPVEEQFKLNVGAGIEVKRSPAETIYVAKSFGRLFYDEGVRMRLEAKASEMEEGFKAAVETGQKSFTGALIVAKDLIEMAQEQQVVFGFLSEDEINKQLKATKSWPAKIVVAKGQQPVDGKAGELELTFKKPTSNADLDTLKVKSQIAFPGEVVVILKKASEPVQGQTVFGEKLRGRVYNELPIYPGKNVVKEKVGEDIIFKSSIYGKVSLDGDRVNVSNTLVVSKDKMEVSMELFPQKQLTFQDISVLLREADVLFGFDKEKLEQELQNVFQKKQRVEKFVVARGKPVQAGLDAKLVYYFDPEKFKEKGLFQRKSGAVLAAPGDLLLTKIMPQYAEDGVNVYREKLPVPSMKEAKDIPVVAGKNVVEVDVGKEGDPKDPPRIEYRAATLGTLTWKDLNIDVVSTLAVDKDERSAQLGLAGNSDFGTPLTVESIQKMALEEGIRVDLDVAAISKALKQERAVDGPLNIVTIAKAVDAKHGSDAVVDYYVEFNGKPIVTHLSQRKAEDETPVFCECVRPNEVLAVKTPAGNGEDGKSIFGRRIAANRGLDDPWRSGFGTDKSKDGLQLVVTSPTPGFVMVEGGRLTVRNTVKISKDKMSATVSIYPTKNSRFLPKEDKILAMLQGAGVKFGIKKDALQEAIETCLESGKPVLDVVVAVGQPPEKGKEATFHYSIDTVENAGQLRQDGSMDFKNRSIFQSVKKGQLLLVKRPPTVGRDGTDILGNNVPGMFGQDLRMDAGVGVEVSANGLEFRAIENGIVEILPKTIRVIPGLLISEDVSLKTGNIEAGGTPVFIRGNVMPDFAVTSEKDVTVEKIAEACTIRAKEAVKVRGGIIGRKKGHIHAGTHLEALYVASDATVEAVGDMTIGSEILNSVVRVGGLLNCTAGAGTICGGELWVYGGMKAKIVGAQGSETQTVIHLGENYFQQKAAEQRVRDEGLDAAMAAVDQKLKDLNKELKRIYDLIPETMKTQIEEGQRLQAHYRTLFEQRQEFIAKIDQLQKQKQAILGEVPRNKDVTLTVLDMIHPGVTIIYKDVVWVLKEPLRGVEIRWNQATSNLISRRI